ncbi:CNNM domain-containing protein [Ignatzschineria rhizosphaerae]|uniref:CNNM domain-containing protein n=1 Tax=Ignatzschineria rhizosphaerae TaxID=2923279 RepID=A0ABY3X5Z7_9GAMM|nr:CNNM domain-containing protein [Ignatzschineria rhizosphaerae]UNM97174.1 CNNM domain-containing protein [Ignatzschineria rhizosphaerae]
MLLLLLIVIASISISFICSILEAVLLSLTPSFISQQKFDRPNLYPKLKKLRDKIDRPLAAILTLNTVAHTVGAAGVGAQVTNLYGNGYLGIASAIMTVLILVLSEIIPKVLGAKYWRRLSPILPTILNPMILLLTPFIWMSDLIMRLIGNSKDEANLRQEIKSITGLAKELKAIEQAEQQVIFNILDLDEVDLTTIMTPRVVTAAITPNTDLETLKQIIDQNQFSRYPIVDQEENPLGVFFRHDFVDLVHSDKSLLDFAEKPALVLPDTISVKSAFRKLLDEKQHLAFIYDEFGSWLGIITLEDILEKIIGEEIMDETDIVQDMRLLAKKRWEMRRN